LRHDADDLPDAVESKFGRAGPADGQRPADDREIAAEPPLPEGG
jgi:hypothetical protein